MAEAESSEGWEAVVGGRRGEGDGLGTVASFVNHVAHRCFKLICFGSKVRISASVRLNPVCCIFTEKGFEASCSMDKFQ